jgi:hypothetical protein
MPAMPHDRSPEQPEAAPPSAQPAPQYPPPSLPLPLQADPPPSSYGALGQPSPPHPYAAAGQAGHTGEGWYQLANVLQVALIVNAVVYAVDAVSSTWLAVRVGSWSDDPAPSHYVDARRADGLSSLLAIGEMLLEIATAVLFICWLFQSYGRPLAERSALRMRRGWAIAGWFIPLAGYVIPYRAVQGVNCATWSPPRPNSRRIIAWWWAYIVFSSLAVKAIGAAPDPTLHHGRRFIRDLRTFEIWHAVSAFPGVVAAVLAALVVAQLTERVRAVTTRQRATR